MVRAVRLAAEQKLRFRLRHPKGLFQFVADATHRGRRVPAAWDDFEEDADLDALLGEQPAPNPDMAEMWQADPELWARLSEGGRQTLSRSMFGDCRAAGEGYFRGEHHAG
jgi:hypothetical protein